MNCPNCGAPVTDTYCSFCGTRMHHQPEAKPQKQTPSQSLLRGAAPRKKNDDSKKNLKALLLSIIGIAVAIALAAGIFSYINHKNEKSLWEQCEKKKQINDLRTYIDKYPDGEHYDDAKKLLDKLVREKEAWEQVRGSNDEEYLRAFIRNHSDSEHIDEARKLLDDVVWDKAMTTNTKIAYEQYLKEFPEGKHVADAQSRLDKKRRAELSTGERNNVRSTVQNFLFGLENWDENLMLSTCNDEMSSFMGKPHATLDDVREYYDAYRESDIDSIGFSDPNVDVKKVIRNDNRVEYRVTFTTTRRMRREEVEGELVASMKGQAVLDDRFRFKEFTMDKVSQ